MSVIVNNITKAAKQSAVQPVNLALVGKKMRLIILLLICLFSACAEKSQKKKGFEMEIIDTYKLDAYKIRDNNHPEAKVIQQLVTEGADLTKLHNPDFKLDFKELKDAKEVAEILSEKSFTSTIYAPQKNFPTYEVVAEKEMLIEFNLMADLTDYLRELAKKHNGVFSGWGTSVEK